MLSIELASRVELLRSLADRADAIALAHFQRPNLATNSKPDASPVTEADLAIESALREMIRRAFPMDAMLGEEHGEEHGEEQGKAHGASSRDERDRSTYRWILDPIDGTVSFANGVPLFGTLIGLECTSTSGHNGTHETCASSIVAGVCSMPALGERVSAIVGQGATWERLGHPPSRARVRACARLADALVCTSGLEYFEKNGTTEALVRVARGAGRLRGFSDCYGGMLVATGRADAWFDPVMNPWDSGPFPVIFAEAGGVFTDWNGRCDIRGGSALAASAPLHAEMLQHLRASIAEGDHP